MTLLKADTEITASTSYRCCFFQRFSRTEGEKIWKLTKNGEERRLSPSLTLLHLLGRRGGRRGDGVGVLLLKESCHFDSHHQGNGCTVPQSSALSDRGLGRGVCVGGCRVVLALLYLCKPTLNGQTPRAGAIVTAACERKIPMVTRRQIQLCLLFIGKQRPGNILQPN